MFAYSLLSVVVNHRLCWLVVGYTMRPIQPAKNYDVISFARAMNDDFGPKVKKLFDTEREAALTAQETGIIYDRY